MTDLGEFALIALAADPEDRFNWVPEALALALNFSLTVLFVKK